MNFRDAREEAAWLGYRDGFDGINPVYTEVSLLTGAQEVSTYRILRACYDEGFKKGKAERK